MTSSRQAASLTLRSRSSSTSGTGGASSTTTRTSRSGSRPRPAVLLNGHPSGQFQRTPIPSSRWSFSSAAMCPVNGRTPRPDCPQVRPGASDAPGAALRPDGHDLVAERRQRDRDQLERGPGHGDADDGDGQRDRGGDVLQGQPPPGHDDPDDVADGAAGARPGLAYQLPPERPERVAGHAEGGHPEGDRHHQDAADQSGEGVADGQPESRDEQPDDVEDETQQSHEATPFPCLVPRSPPSRRDRASTGMTTRGRPRFRIRRSAHPGPGRAPPRCPAARAGPNCDPDIRAALWPGAGGPPYD